MMRRPAAALLLALAAACGPGDDATPGGGGEELGLAVELTERQRERIAALSPLPPIPPDPTNRVADDPRAAWLGQALFFDERLSGNGQVSCATCHVPETGFTDGRTLAVGVSVGNRHTPTLWNVAHHRWLTWDGRADSLWMQALDPIEDPREMGSTRIDVLRVVANDARLRDAYVELFGELPEGLAGWPSARPPRRGEASAGLAPEATAWESLDAETRERATRAYTHVGKAIAAYQRRLVRGDSPFDRFAHALDGREGGDPAALSPSAQRGLALFLGRANCAICHSGPTFSDGEFHNNALPTIHGGDPVDPGRYEGAEVVRASEFNAAGPYSDERDGVRAERAARLKVTSETFGEFRTPSLRNLDGRAPFMHQGQFATLDDVIAFYDTLEGSSGRNHHQETILVPLQLSPGERADLRAFLDSLVGSAVDPALLRAPD